MLNVNDIDIACLSKTYAIPVDDIIWNIPAHLIIRSDHPSNTKRGGTYQYHKEHLTNIRGDDISTPKEFLVTEIAVKNEECFTHGYIAPITKIMNSFSPFVILLTFLWHSS